MEETFATDSMIVLLNTSVDYEVNKYYTIIFQVIDDIKFPPLTGQATLKVKYDKEYRERVMERDKERRGRGGVRVERR